MVRFIDQTMTNLARLTIKILVKSTKTSFFQFFSCILLLSSHKLSIEDKGNDGKAQIMISIRLECNRLSIYRFSFLSGTVTWQLPGKKDFSQEGNMISGK